MEFYRQKHIDYIKSLDTVSSVKSVVSLANNAETRRCGVLVLWPLENEYVVTKDGTTLTVQVASTGD